MIGLHCSCTCKLLFIAMLAMAMSCATESAGYSYYCSGEFYKVPGVCIYCMHTNTNQCLFLDLANSRGQDLLQKGGGAPWLA